MTTEARLSWGQLLGYEKKNRHSKLQKPKSCSLWYGLSIRLKGKLFHIHHSEQFYGAIMAKSPLCPYIFHLKPRSNTKIWKRHFCLWHVNFLFKSLKRPLLFRSLHQSLTIISYTHRYHIRNKGSTIKMLNIRYYYPLEMVKKYVPDHVQSECLNKHTIYPLHQLNNDSQSESQS